MSIGLLFWLIMVIWLGAAQRRDVMSIGLLFWLIMVIWLLFGVGVAWPRDEANRYGFGSNLVLWVVIALLGWKVFGFVVQG